jgi:hypothetical protein
MVTELRNRHNAGETTAGINVRKGGISDMWEERVVQPLLVNTSEINLSTECVGTCVRYIILFPGATIPILNPSDAFLFHAFRNFVLPYFFFRNVTANTNAAPIAIHAMPH